MADDRGASSDVVARAELLGLVTERLPRTIERDDYTPALLALLSNVLVWGGSRVFHHLHGIGTTNGASSVRSATAPARRRASCANSSASTSSIASRSVNVLLDRDLIAQLNGPRGSRHLYLTAAGARVHDDFMPIALRRQDILHENLSPDGGGSAEHAPGAHARLRRGDAAIRERDPDRRHGRRSYAGANVSRSGSNAVSGR